MRKIISVIFLLFIFSLFSPNHLNAQDPEYFGGEAGKKVDWTLFYLNSYYVDSTDADHLAELAIIKMLQELDPFSVYQSKRALDEQRRADEGIKNDGIGIRYYVVNDTATITYIDESGPSGTAGLLKGDKILSLNNVNTVGRNYSTIDDLILADRGTTLNFRIKRQNVRNPIAIRVTSESLFAASVDAAYKIDGDIGYIRLNRFTMKTLTEVTNAINNLKQQGVKNLILDLRDNRGGVVVGATNLADEFLPAGKLIMTSEGKGMPKKEIYSTAKGVFENGKVTILVNTATASASEIFTSALQEWDRALVLGEVTYGKGLIQQSYLLGDSSAVRLTIGRYFTPTGRMLQRPYQFDTSSDWIFQNITNAVHYNGFTNVLNTPPSYQWMTKSGRKILRGQGSIIPDLYMPREIVDQPQVATLNAYGILYKFAVYHADYYRPYYLNHYKTGNNFRLDKSVDKGILNNFRAFLMAHLSDKNLAKSILNEGISNHVLTQIKAWIAPQIWETGAYYSIFNEEDKVVIRAIDAMRDGTFELLGIN